MWFARTTDGYQAWFALKDQGGTLRTGALPGAFVATVVEPGDTALNVSAVAESATKPGLYTFTVPAGFLISNGVGEYGVLVEINVPAPKKVRDVLHEPMVVSLEDWDSLSAGLAIIPSAVWGEVLDGTTTAGTMMARFNAWVRGKVTLAGTLASYFAENATTILFKNNKTPTERTPTP
jgi:hypothetical protein